MLAEDWLNRIGIILNFLAGFLLSPTLLGLERLQRIEAWAERKLTATRQWSQSEAAITTAAVMLAAVITIEVISGFAITLRLGSGRDVLMYVGLLMVFAVCLVLLVARKQSPASLSVRLVGFLAEAAIRSLEGNDRLIGWITAAGIITFIVGNALQFVATFHPGK